MIASFAAAAAMLAPADDNLVLLTAEGAPAVAAAPIAAAADHACCATDACALGSGPSAKKWMYAEYLGWYATGDRANSFSSMIGDNQPQSRTLLDDYRSGVRVGGGKWLGDCGKTAFEWNAWWLPRISHDQPVEQGTFQDGRTTTRFSVHESERNELWGAAAGFRRRLRECNDCCNRSAVDLLYGWQFLQMNERIDLDLVAATVGNDQPIRLLRETVRLEAVNNFHGAYLGLGKEIERGKLFVSLRGTVALGNNQEVLRASADVSQTVGGVTTTNSFSASSVRNRFAVLPEVTLRVGKKVNDKLTAYVGYNLIYLSDVVRGSDALAALGGGFGPHHDLFVHGFMVGGMVKF